MEKYLVTTTELLVTVSVTSLLSSVAIDEDLAGFPEPADYGPAGS